MKEWEEPVFLSACSRGWLEGDSALCSMPWGLCCGACPTGGEPACRMEGFDLFLTTEICFLMRRGERIQKGLEEKERCDNFSGLLWLPIAPAVGLPKPSSLSFQLTMAVLCLPWVWGPGQECRSEQILYFMLVLVLPSTAIMLHTSHCPHLQVMGSYFSAGGPWGRVSCWLPWVRGGRYCESARVLCSRHVLLEHLFCIAEAALAPLVTAESRLLWAGSSAWERAQLTALSCPLLLPTWGGSTHCPAKFSCCLPLSVQVFLAREVSCHLVVLLHICVLYHYK